MIPIIIQVDNSLMQKLKTIAVHLKSSMIMMIRTWKVLHNLASRASHYFNKWWSIEYYNSNPFNPALTSLEEVVVLGYIQKPRDPTQGGTNPNEINQICWWRVHQCLIWSWTKLLLILNANRGGDWTNTSAFWVNHQPQRSQTNPHVWRRERGRNSR